MAEKDNLGESMKTKKKKNLIKTLVEKEAKSKCYRSREDSNLQSSDP